MAVTVSISPKDTKAQFGVKQTFTATMSGMTGSDNVTIVQWVVNGNVNTTNELTFEYTPNSVGEFVLRCAVGYSDYINNLNVVVDATKFSVDTEVDIEVIGIKPEYLVDLDSPIHVSPEIEFIPFLPDDSTVTYTWRKGDEVIFVGKDFQVPSVVESDAGAYTFEVTVDGPYVAAPVSKTFAASIVVEELHDDDVVKYIHPLPQRKSAYLWQGWWVMDEIEKATAAGIDWRKPSELKYQDDLMTISYMLNAYPNVEIQESRNGYILGRDKIESGKIY